MRVPRSMHARVRTCTSSAATAYRFELAAPTRFGLVTFRLKASDEANETLRYGTNIRVRIVLFWRGEKVMLLL